MAFYELKVEMEIIHAPSMFINASDALLLWDIKLQYMWPLETRNGSYRKVQVFNFCTFPQPHKLHVHILKIHLVNRNACLEPTRQNRYKKIQERHEWTLC